MRVPVFVHDPNPNPSPSNLLRVPAFVHDTFQIPGLCLTPFDSLAVEGVEKYRGREHGLWGAPPVADTADGSDCWSGRNQNVDSPEVS